MGLQAIPDKAWRNLLIHNKVSMKSHFAYLIAALAFLLAGAGSAYAQDIIIVGGKVLNKNNGKPIEEIVTVYS